VAAEVASARRVVSGTVKSRGGWGVDRGMGACWSARRGAEAEMHLERGAVKGMAQRCLAAADWRRSTDLLRKTRCIVDFEGAQRAVG
jgi:hypothetical protein